MASTRLQWLDSVRGLAAVAVLVEHYVALRFSAYNAGGRHILHFGYGAVVAFLLVSGYVIPLTLERTNNLGRFWRSRVFRLYPIYLLSLVIAIALHVKGHPGVGDPEFSDHLLANSTISLTMLQGLFGTPFALGVSWSLTIEMVFYLTMSGLFLLRWHKNSLLLAACALLMFAVAALSTGGISLSLAVCYVTPFIGVLFYRLHSDELRSRSAWIAMGASVLIMSWGWFAQPSCRGDMAGGITGYAFFASFFLVPKLGNAVFAWLGQISYSIYLLHTFVVYGLPRAWSRFPILFNPAISLTAAILITITVAWLSYRFLETPMNKLGKSSAPRTSSECEVLSPMPHVAVTQAD